MATKKWDGSTDGNFGTAANWEGGVAPVNGDDVVIDYGTRNIDNGLTTGLDLASLSVGPNYKGQIGTGPTNPLDFGATGDVTFNGGGALHYISANANNIDTVRLVRVGPLGTGCVYLCGANTIDNLIVQGGCAVIDPDDDGLTITLAILAGDIANVGGGAQMHLWNGTITTLLAKRGQITSQFLKDDYPAHGGVTVTTLRNTGAAMSILETHTLTNIELHAGQIDYAGDQDITLLRAVSGNFNASGNAEPKTITTLELYPGAAVDLDNGPKNITVTTQKDYGGTLGKVGAFSFSSFSTST